MFKPTRAILFLVLLLALFSTHQQIPAAPATWQAKVDNWVLTSAQSGETEFLLYLTEQADLSGAEELKTKHEKGSYVYAELTKAAARSQKPLLAALSKMGVEHRSYWIANMIWVRGNLKIVDTLAKRNDVGHIYANPSVHLDLPIISPHQEGEFTQNTPSTVEWNISKVRAPQVWDAGYTGNGVVIGGQDTGYDWDHPALINQYRGWNGTSEDHNYNWHDAIHSGGGDCGPDSPEPCDDFWHGTHTMGTMVGDDGAEEQIGMAPGARWIGCRNMDQGDGTPARYIECFEWFIAPTKLNGNKPDPDLAPDVINNSWYCPPEEGCEFWDSLRPVVNNTRAAGIVVVVSAGNFTTLDEKCGTVDYPPAIYDSSFSVGATDSSDYITSFSSRGPADHTNLPKPDISAPGQNIRSSIPGGGYVSSDGTSMSAPHVSGLVALLLSARPYLAGQVKAIESQIEQNALPLTTLENCGGIPGSQIPNNTYGWGRIDALETIFDFTYYPLIMKSP
jgi:subtilisin family serine protease